jgi:hypothetical protein
MSCVVFLWLYAAIGSVSGQTGETETMVGNTWNGQELSETKYVLQNVRHLRATLSSNVRRRLGVLKGVQP